MHKPAIFLTGAIVTLAGCQSMGIDMSNLGSLGSLNPFSSDFGKVDVSMPSPPKYPEASRLRKVAVLDFDGSEQEDGGRFRQDVEATLANVRLNGETYFTVVERSEMERIAKMHDQELVNMRFDASTAAEFGRWLGVDGIYFGKVDGLIQEDSAYTESRSECAAYDSDKKCISRKEHSVNCTKRQASYSFTPKLVSVESAHIVYSNNIDGAAFDKVCEDKSRPLKAVTELSGEAKSQALNSMAQDIAPYVATEKVAVMTKYIDDPYVSELVKAGKKFAKGNRWDRACSNWKEAIDLMPGSISLLYNMGICAERNGDFEQALKYYEEADQLVPKPDKEISKRLLDVKDKIRRSEV